MEKSTFKTKVGLAEMLKGGVIMDVVDAEQAAVAEDAVAPEEAAPEVGRVARDEVARGTMRRREGSQRRAVGNARRDV